MSGLSGLSGLCRMGREGLVLVRGAMGEVAI